MEPSPADLARTIRSKTDEELYRILHVHSQDYTLTALSQASVEFKRRKLDEATMRRAEAAPEKELATTDLSHVGSERKPLSSTGETALGWGCLVLLWLVGSGIYGGYKWLDSIGWISHREETTISARSDWLVGESKECWSPTLNSANEAFLHSEEGVGYAMPYVLCDDGPEHKMTITFYGRKVQAEYKAVSWRCIRAEVSFLNDNSFTCYQTGGDR